MIKPGRNAHILADASAKRIETLEKIRLLTEALSVDEHKEKELLLEDLKPQHTSFAKYLRYLGVLDDLFRHNKSKQTFIFDKRKGIADSRAIMEKLGLLVTLWGITFKVLGSDTQQMTVYFYGPN